MENILAAFTEGLGIEVLVRMGLAIVLGGMIGLEREHRGRAAGLRTMIIVCLGSTIIMIVSTELPMQFYSGPGEAVVRVDPGRIAAGIVTGIGFLGACVVLKLGDIERGVTTAACIWFVAALGIAIGQGHYVLSVLATALALIVLGALHYLELRFRSGVYRRIVVKVDADRSPEALAQVRGLLHEDGATLLDLRTSEVKSEAQTSLCFFVKCRQDFQSHDLVKKMCSIDGVLSVSWEGG